MYRSLYKITDRKIEFAILGCGRISTKHFEAIQSGYINYPMMETENSISSKISKQVVIPSIY